MKVTDERRVKNPRGDKMKAGAAFLILITVLVFCEPKNSEKRIVLPNSNLMRCATTHLWQDEKPGANSIYPVQVGIDHFDNQGCPQGIVALYEKTVSLNDIKAALDQRYGKWGGTDNGRIMLWRVEPEKFAIQLTTIDDSLREAREPGMKQVIYLAFSLSKWRAVPR
jgi:hypothetical protein